MTRGHILEFPHSAPTFHEQLEARLELRDWVRGKVPDSQIEEWLAGG